MPLPHYDRGARALHWLSALLLVAIAVLGLGMEEAAGLQRRQMMGLHKSLGLTLLAITVLRLAWRMLRPGPAALPGSPWLRRAAGAGHWGLYAMLLAMPLSGWAMGSAAGRPPRWFGQFTLPAIAPRSEALDATMETLHVAGFWVLAALVAGHVVAALYHHWVLGDGTLGRMWPGR